MTQKKDTNTTPKPATKDCKIPCGKCEKNNTCINVCPAHKKKKEV